jgi:hypothetical protein
VGHSFSCSLNPGTDLAQKAPENPRRWLDDTQSGVFCTLLTGPSLMHGTPRLQSSWLSVPLPQLPKPDSSKPPSEGSKSKPTFKDASVLNFPDHEILSPHLIIIPTRQLLMICRSPLG